MNNKCIIENKFITPCWSLERHLKGVNLKVTGLVFFQYKNVETFERTVDFIVYKESSRDRGVICNFCPFCGEKLHNEFDTMEKKDKI